MATLTHVYTFTGSEPNPASLFEIAVGPFTGAYSITHTLSSPPVAVAKLGYNLKQSDEDSCYGSTTWLFGGETTNTWNGVVGTPPGDWHCLDWTHLSVNIWDPAWGTGAGTVLTTTLTYTPPAGSTICAYGTEQKDPGVSVVDLISVAVGRLISGTDPRWLFAILAGFAGRWIYLNKLCSSLPPPDEDFEPGDFVPSGVMDPIPKATRKASIKLTRLLWDEYCQCKAATGGDPPPVGPGTTNITQPTWYVTNNNYTITNNDIANTLNLYLTLNGGNTHVDSQQLALATSPTRCPPEAYEYGTVHPDLVGEGRFDVENVVGFRIDVTERPGAGIVLTGQPQYLWNMGWVSTLADDALLEEKRVTRESYLWFPCSVHLTTEFTYSLREFVQVTVTELVRPAEIVLAG